MAEPSFLHYLVYMGQLLPEKWYDCRIYVANIIIDVSEFLINVTAEGGFKLAMHGI